jgi:hypothetical protein
MYNMTLYIYAPIFRPRFAARETALDGTLIMRDLFSADVQYHETHIVNTANGKSIPADVWLAARERVQ